MFTFIGCFFKSLIYTEYKSKGDFIYEISAKQGRTGDHRVSSFDSNCFSISFDRFKTFWTGNFKLHSGFLEKCLRINSNQNIRAIKC